MSSVAWAAYYEDNLILPSPQYMERQGEVIVYTNMVQCRQIHALNITPRQEMTPGGGPYPMSITFDVALELSTDGGVVYQPALAQGEAQLLFTAGGGGGAALFEIKLDYDKIFRIFGGNLPPNVMIRESPTLDSTGRSTCTALTGPSGGYEIESFFDVYTEITLDGGQTWYPSIDSAPMHMTGTPEPATLSLLVLGGLALLGRRRVAPRTDRP
jgi:hypothetical protein